MMIRALSILITLFALCFAANSVAGSTVFEQAKWSEVKQQFKGQRWLALLWSVDCPPCFKELALIEKLQEKHGKLAVVIINADDNDEIGSERTQILANFGLEENAIYHFADGMGDQARFAIDPSWYGELPRSYFFDESGNAHGKSGLVKESLLKQWLSL